MTASADTSLLADLSWPQVSEHTILLVPVGATEQHGPHLPFDVDTMIADAVCRAAAAQIGGHVRVAPALPYGASGEHQDFPGTLSIGTEALALVLVELARSAKTWAARIVFVNGHGGNLDAIARARDILRAEGAPVSWHACRHGGIHADRPETSIALHLTPGRVAPWTAEPGTAGSMSDLLPRLRESGVRAVSETGVLGDPSGADAAEGAALLDRLIADLVRHVQEISG
ncbi:MAG: mycofactocin biosynthesis peptidyl-dipeptidase MftE [Actinobacteria bacterium]|nr:mycofactocin biosynthesis peptidyl-dipeptidase MftE [Actinomycetota bacterium]